MKNNQPKAVQQKRQFLINELIRSGIFKKNNKHLYEWTMGELETEYQYIDTNGLESSFKNQ
ncbi:Fur-regulated basic protein FbpA [Bacillus sp. ISL-40]|uniref:Fur-regulated basic protein FbpA n=1 Tax=unclassified Bacillus (in: firmicutes) TaxID=185979 RepID=UPI001BEC306B|nr:MULTISPECIES: Fur-regulated basic protein FbpA [unclassified Bacillus (in: firmicutes)]MBT2698774.1 Fur-regulated basic protein FbpA [Bacillus sp. ISL-40]MBT2720780.1 Fur-regulated basic protein FbpA [Bacillus sp. ISL-46]MBT2740940.1 Fur-regulated basic protein FbpA [Bacillus sp. ISL-77]